MNMPGLFVTGTDTGVGKTRVAAEVVRALVAGGRRVGVLKPVATGVRFEGETWHSDDVDALIEAAGAPVPRERVAPVVFDEPLAPSVAARRRGTPLDQSSLERLVFHALDWWAERADVVIVEGIGGLLCPLAEGTTVADLAVALDYPVLVVARRGLGTLNHTLLTVEAARARGLRLAGLVLNGAEPVASPLAEATNAEELARRLAGCPILAELPHASDPSVLYTLLGPLDWYPRCLPPRFSGRAGESANLRNAETSHDVE